MYDPNRKENQANALKISSYLMENKSLSAVFKALIKDYYCKIVTPIVP